MKYIFTEEQFAALLAVGNMGKFYSFDLTADMADGELIEAVYSFYHRKWIRREEGRFVPRPDLAGMLKAMKSAPYAVKLTLARPEIPERLVYPDGEGSIVAAERCRSSRENSVKLQRIRLEDLLFEIMDNEMDCFAPALTKEEEEALCLEALYREAKPAFRAERIRTADGETAAVLAVRSTPLFCVTRWEWAGSPLFALYSETDFKERFKLLTGGEMP